MATRAATVTAVVLAVSLLGCASEPERKGYEPRPDHQSDPLSPRDNEKAEQAVVLIDSACKPLPEDDSDSRDRASFGRKGSDTLRAIATEHRHAVFSNPPFGFSGDTMIQTLERIAHAYNDCRYAKELGEHAARLRER